MKRAELRDHIFKVVFGIEFNNEVEREEQIRLYIDQLEDVQEKDVDYITAKVEKIAEHIPEIDQQINEVAKRWKTGRMNKVDLSILRLAIYEMKWDDDVPVGVAIDQAVELAKKYSSDESPAFINGILAKLANE